MSENRLFSFWQGPTGWMEQMTVNSAQKLGYDVTVYTYQDHLDLPCRIADAREVLPEPEQMMGLAGYSDWFRAQGLANDLGVWTDLDVAYLQRIPDEDFVYGWCSPSKINGAILRLPPNAQVLHDYLDYLAEHAASQELPMWYPLHRRLARRVKYALRGSTPKPMLGPRALTHFLGRAGLLQHALPRTMFYAVPSDAEEVEELSREWPVLGTNTCALHLWNSLWPRDEGGVRRRPPWLLVEDAVADDAQA